MKGILFFARLLPPLPPPPHPHHPLLAHATLALRPRNPPCRFVTSHLECVKRLCVNAPRRLVRNTPRVVITNRVHAARNATFVLAKPNLVFINRPNETTATTSKTTIRFSPTPSLFASSKTVMIEIHKLVEKNLERPACL